MNILCACEESQAVCKAFRAIGHNAYSADVQECSGGHPEWHIHGDVLPILRGGEFITQSGASVSVEKWDMLIAFPPCTYLSNAGAVRLFPNKQLNEERYKKGLQGKSFFMQFYNADIPFICVENPIPSKIFEIPPYTQTVQPYEHGHPYTKKTCLWLKGLPLIDPTNIVEPTMAWVSAGSIGRKLQGAKHRSPKMRSKFFPGIAAAMAEQWGKGFKVIEQGKLF